MGTSTPPPVVKTVLKLRLTDKAQMLAGLGLCFTGEPDPRPKSYLVVLTCPYANMDS
jgi:hypothetical protein